MKYKQFFALISFLFFSGNFFLGIIAHAEENDNVGFSVSPNYNQAQRTDSSFFDLLIKPNTQQKIGITISNTSKEDSIYYIKLNQASTNENGIIDYTDFKDKLSESAPFLLKKISNYESKIKLSPGEVKEVPIILNIPDSSFKGEVLGGVSVTKELPKKDNPGQLANQYSYVIGLRLRERKENPERDLLAGKATPLVSFGKTGVGVPIINKQANTMGNLQIDSTLKKEGKEVAHEIYKNREIAPNSIYPYSLSWNSQKYSPGNYELTLSIKDAQSHIWTFKRKFTLSAEEVTKIKKEAVHPSQNTDYWLWSIIVIFSIITSILIYFIIKMRRANKKGGSSG